MKMTKRNFMKFVLEYRSIERSITEAELFLGFEFSTAGVISQLYDKIYQLLFYLSNSKDKDNFYDDLNKALYLSETNLEEFYEKHFEVAK